MAKYILLGLVILLLLTGCPRIQTLPQDSLTSDVSAADTQFTLIVAQMHVEHEKGNLCLFKLRKMQDGVRVANKYIEQAYDAAVVKNFATVSQLLTRIETIRRTLEFELEIIKLGDSNDGCVDERGRVTQLTPAFT